MFYNDSEIKLSKEKTISLFFRTHEKWETYTTQENDFVSAKMR